MRGNIKSFEKPFTHAEVVALAEHTLKRFGGDRHKAGRYARSMEDRYESAKWAQVVEVLATRGRQHATKKTARSAPFDQETYEDALGWNPDRIERELSAISAYMTTHWNMMSEKNKQTLLRERGAIRKAQLELLHEEKLRKRHVALPVPGDQPRKKSAAQLRREIDEALGHSGTRLKS